MSIYILKNGEEIGPLKTSEIQALLDADCINAQQAIRYEDGSNGIIQSLDGIRLSKPNRLTSIKSETNELGNSPMASISRDVKTIKKNTSTVANELNKFLVEIRGKSPNEMLGAFAKSSLVQSGITATIILFCLLAITTIIPFVLNKNKISKPNITIDTSVNTSQPITPKKTITTQIPNNSATNKPVKTTSKEQESVAKTLGIGESKEGAPPEQNPFESTDDLLQELE